MTSERIRSQVERPLAEAEGALVNLDREQVKVKLEAVLYLDFENEDATCRWSLHPQDFCFVLSYQ